MSLITDYEDRIMVVKVKKEMEEMERAVAKTPRVLHVTVKHAALACRCETS